MKYALAILLNLFFLTGIFAQNSQNIVTTDIDNFWTAYDKIVTTKDRSAQLDYINKLYINKGSLGLKALMQVRNYTDESYIDAINDYPLFWRSIRANTLKSKQVTDDIKTNIAKLKKIYPDLKPANIYFSIGALKTGGTTMGNMVLIGSELAMADPTTVATEFSVQFPNIKPFFATNPIATLAQSMTHEYVHAQQKTTATNSLLGQAVVEGVAEFVAIKATGNPHPVTAPYVYGKQNKEKVRAKFAAQMFNTETGFWFYSNAENEFKTRDMGYYIGYAICEEYYRKSKNKKSAIKEMIELDYDNLSELEKFVEKSGFFPKSMKEYEQEYRQNRPQVIGLEPVINGGTKVSPSVTQLTVKFSKPMNTDYRNFEFGPLGENALLKIKKFLGFSEDGKSYSIEIEPLAPNKRYQLTIGSGFRDEAGVSLKPYLIDFTTAGE